MKIKPTAMKRLALCAALLAAVPAFAQDAGSPLRFQLGLTAVSGMSDLKDAIVANNPNLSVSTLSPVGLSALFAYRVTSDWALVGSLGPIAVATGDASFTIVPLGVSMRYDFARGEGGAPFARVGVEKAIANGDFIETGSAGVVAGLGYEFGDGRRGGWGLELAYRAVKVDVPGRTAALTKTAQPYKASLTAYWAF